jgi:ribosomal-protein-alanine N-acetyltransferase
VGAAWAADHLSRKAFTNRVYWAQRSISQGSAVPLFMIRREGEALLGAITLDNIRRGPAQAGTLGYWIGAPMPGRATCARRSKRWCTMPSTGSTSAGSRPPACRRTPPRAGCWRSCGFKYEGVAQSYLQINGRWRNHVLYANLRSDRRGRTDVG